MSPRARSKRTISFMLLREISRRLGLAVGVAVVVAVAVIGLGGAGAKGGRGSAPAASSAKAGRRTAQPTSGLSPSELRALAFDVAKRNGDGAPTSIEAVKTTYREAWRLMFPGMPPTVLPAATTPVDFIVMTGHFIDWNVGPSNTTVTGIQLHLVVDMNGKVLDGGVDHRRHPILLGSGR